ncbi:IS66 family insertion sequence element accessory protein TnpA [Endozoicomonas sp. 2B-B]
MSKKLPADSEWLERVQSWRDSGLTQSAWCQQHGIRVSKFGYWKRKLDTTPSVKPTPNNSGFVQVTPQPEPGAPSRITPLSITLPSGVTVSGIDESNLSLCEQLVRDML